MARKRFYPCLWDLRCGSREFRHGIAGEDGSSTLNVQGSGSTVSLSGIGLRDGNPQGTTMNIGRSGFGKATVSEGGEIDIDGDFGPFTGFRLGRDEGGNAKLTVDGAGSKVKVNSDVGQGNRVNELVIRR